MYVHTIRPQDVGKIVVRSIVTRGTLYVGDAIGTVQQRDVGKRCYLVDGVLQVENDEQLAARQH
jgi:hypothetical protein